MTDIVESLMADIRKQSNCLTVKDTPSNAVVTLKQRHVLRIIEENERLRQQVTQRGARMQVMREWMENKMEDWKMEISTDMIWEWFLYARPEAADWFDEDGVPR